MATPNTPWVADFFWGLLSEARSPRTGKGKLKLALPTLFSWGPLMSINVSHLTYIIGTMTLKTITSTK